MCYRSKNRRTRWKTFPPPSK